MTLLRQLNLRANLGTNTYSFSSPQNKLTKQPCFENKSPPQQYTAYTCTTEILNKYREIATDPRTKDA